MNLGYFWRCWPIRLTKWFNVAIWNMEQVMSERNQKMHPHKFTLWVAIGSITMMFAGFTKKWTDFRKKWTNIYGKSIISLRFKRDHKKQKRIQCGISRNNFINIVLKLVANTGPH